jgi:hypothetical protein
VVLLDSYPSINPYFTVGRAILESFHKACGISKNDFPITIYESHPAAPQSHLLPRAQIYASRQRTKLQPQFIETVSRHAALNRLCLGWRLGERVQPTRVHPGSLETIVEG